MLALFKPGAAVVVHPETPGYRRFRGRVGVIVRRLRFSVHGFTGPSYAVRIGRQARLVIECEAAELRLLS